VQTCALPIVKPAAWELEVLKCELLGGSEVSFYGSSGFRRFPTVHNWLSKGHGQMAHPAYGVQARLLQHPTAATATAGTGNRGSWADDRRSSSALARARAMRSEVRECERMNARNGAPSPSTPCQSATRRTIPLGPERAAKASRCPRSSDSCSRSRLHPRQMSCVTRTAAVY